MKRQIILILISSIILFSNSAWAKTADAQNLTNLMFLEHVIEPTPEYTGILGSGIFSPTSEVRNICVEFDSPETTEHKDGQNVNYFIEHIKSSVELKSLWRLNASGSIGIGPFSASAKSRYLKKRKFSLFESTLLVKAEVKNQIHTIDNIRLKAEARDLLMSENGAKKFFDACGDHFLVGMVTGGEYDAVIEIRSSSAEDHRRREGDFSLRYAGSMAQSDWETDVTKLIKDSNTRITQFWKGGNENIPSKDKILEFARSLPSRVNPGNGDIVYSYTSRSYCTLLDPLMHDNCSRLDSSVLKLKKLYDRLDEAESLQRDLKFIKNNLREFIFQKDKPTINELKKNIDKDIKLFSKMAKTCLGRLGNRTSCDEEIPLPAVSEESLPKRITHTQLYSGKCQGWEMFATKKRVDYGIGQFCLFNKPAGFTVTKEFPNHGPEIFMVKEKAVGKGCAPGLIGISDYNKCQTKSIGYAVPMSIDGKYEMLIIEPGCGLIHHWHNLIIKGIMVPVGPHTCPMPSLNAQTYE